MMKRRNKSGKNLGSSFSITDKKKRKSEDEKPPIPWTELPSIAVENIYGFLNREEQCRMSIVCKNWREEYSSPNLWRTVKFLIPDHDLNLKVYPEVKFAIKYGDMFHHVEIACPTRRIRSRYRELIWKQIKLFLEALTFHSQLETVSLLHVGLFINLDDTISDDFYPTIKNFFSSQHTLKTVEFRKAYFKNSEAAEILRIIFLNSKSLQNMCLDRFIDEGSNSDNEITENVGTLEEKIQPFLNLKTLQIDYSQDFETAMIFICERAQNSDSRKLKGNLELIKIFCYGNEGTRYRGIPPECWKLFTEICPFLRINLTYQIEAKIRNRIDLFVVRNMPLKMLTCINSAHRRQAGPETEIGVLFRHLQSSRTHECLEDLTIIWKGNLNNLAIDLINFLQTCEKLRIFQLYIEHPVESLDIVLSSWLENRPPSLQNVFIDVGVGNAQRPKAAAIYSNMADDYCPLLQIRGLNLRLIVVSKRPVR